MDGNSRIDEVLPAKLVLVRRRLRQTEVARRLGCSASYVSSVVSGRRPPSRAFARDLGLLLGLPAEELFPSISHSQLNGSLPTRRGARHIPCKTN